MPKLYKYRKVIDEYTTHTVQGEGIVELCEIDGDTIISVPNTLKLEVSKGLSVQALELTEDLSAAIKEKSAVVKMANTMVVEKIREKYDINDELKIIRKMLRYLVVGTAADETMLKEYNDYIAYVDNCTNWGTEEKAKLGVAVKTVAILKIEEIAEEVGK